MDQNERICQLALFFTPGIGDFLFKQLISYCGSASTVLKTSQAKLRKIPGVGTKVAEAVRTAEKFKDRAENEFQLSIKMGAQVLMYNDPDYPRRLREINDSPPIVFYQGNTDLNNERIVSIVGTRNATDYGKQVVSELLEGLAAFAPLVVSGLAYGIDVHAHKECLRLGIPTLGVMASGMDIIYPTYHRKIAGKMVKNGGLMTEHPMGTKPEAPYFPSRNRIIAGLSDAVVVVEAASRGGALITAELANGYNREVFAVPGNLNNTFSEGCNKLIRNHKAYIMTSAEDLAYILGWPPEGEDLPSSHRKGPDLSQLDGNEKKIAEVLTENQEGVTIDQLSWQSQIPMNQIAGDLLNMEFKGLVASLPGKKYRIKTP